MASTQKVRQKSLVQPILFTATMKCLHCNLNLSVGSQHAGLLDIDHMNMECKSTVESCHCIRAFNIAIYLTWIWAKLPSSPLAPWAWLKHPVIQWRFPSLGGVGEKQECREQLSALFLGISCPFLFLAPPSEKLPDLDDWAISLVPHTHNFPLPLFSFYAHTPS